MGCDKCRELLSARLDGEDLPGESALADEHVADCAACGRWLDDAAAVTRLVRLQAAPVGPDPVLSSRVFPDVLALSAPGPARRRVALALRWFLGLLGSVQFLLGMAQVGLSSSGVHDHTGGVSPAHLSHESAAWNIAVGAGFGWIALRRTRPTGLIPLLTAFVVMLLLLSTNDLWLGSVDGARLLSHGFVLTGYVVLLVLSRPRFDFGDPPPAQGPSPRQPMPGGDRTDPAPSPAAAPLRLVTRAVPVPTTRYDRAA